MRSVCVKAATAPAAEERTEDGRWFNREGSVRIFVSRAAGDKRVDVYKEDALIATDRFGENTHAVYITLRGIELAFRHSLAVFPWDCDLALLRLWCFVGRGGWHLGFYRPLGAPNDDDELDVISILRGPQGWQWSFIGFWDRTNHATAESALDAVLAHLIEQGFLV